MDILTLQAVLEEAQRMSIVFKQGRSDSYRFTVYSLDSPTLQTLRDGISKVNKSGKLKYPLQVSVRGRRPTTGYTWGGGIIGGLRNATEFDVYVYRR